MVSSDEKRRLIASYPEPRRPRAIVAKAMAGMLIVALITAIGARYPERDETQIAGGDTKSGNAKSAAGQVSSKQAESGR